MYFTSSLLSVLAFYVLNGHVITASEAVSKKDLVFVDIGPSGHSLAEAGTGGLAGYNPPDKTSILWFSSNCPVGPGTTSFQITAQVKTNFIRFSADASWSVNSWGATTFKSPAKPGDPVEATAIFFRRTTCFSDDGGRRQCYYQYRGAVRAKVWPDHIILEIAYWQANPSVMQMCNDWTKCHGDNKVAYRCPVTRSWVTDN